MKKVLRSLIAIAAIAAAAISCAKTETPLSYDGDTVIEFPADGGTKVVTVKGDNEITLTSSAKWVKATNVKNDITIEVGAVPSETARKATLTVSNGVDTPIEFSIKQEGGKFNFTPQSEYVIPLAGGSFEIPYETNFEFEITSEASWLKIEQKAAVVAFSAEASTEARETKVSYLAGSNSGEFVVKQYNPVVGTLEVYLDENTAKGYYKYNSVWFTAKGEGITSAAVTLTPASTFEANGREYYENLLKTESKFSLASVLSNLNSASGFKGTFTGLAGRSKYVVCLLLSNGSSEKLLVGEITTENNPDPFQATYPEDELYYITTDPTTKTWDIYSNGGYPSGTTGQVSGFGKRIKIGSCTFTNAGASSVDPSAVLLTTNGMIKAMTSGALDLPMNHHFVSSAQGGTLYFEAPYIDFPSGEENQFYELCGWCAYSGSNKYQTPLYPLLAASGTQDNSVIVYVDGGYGETKGVGSFEHLAMYLFLMQGDINNPDTAEPVGNPLLFGVFYDTILIDPAVIKPTSYVGAPMNYYAIDVKKQPNNHVEVEALVARNETIRSGRRITLEKNVLK